MAQVGTQPFQWTREYTGDQFRKVSRLQHLWRELFREDGERGHPEEQSVN